MYQPAKHTTQDVAQMWRFIKNHPFAIITQQLKDELIATHLPFLVWKKKDGQNILHSHLARHNAQAKSIADGRDALIIFSENRGYASPPEEMRPEVGTWDYSAVHVHARIQPMSREKLLNSVSELTSHFETLRDNPHLVKDLPEKMVRDHLDRILGFTATPYRIQGIEKRPH